MFQPIFFSWAYINTLVLHFFLCCLAPVVAGDTSDEESDDDENNGTQWGRNKKKEIIVGEEEGLYNASAAPSTPTTQHVPVLGGPFSALISSMWPQDTLGQVQQVCTTVFIILSYYIIWE